MSLVYRVRPTSSHLGRSIRPTAILKRKEIVPNIVTAGLETVAIRIPNNEIAQKIIENANVPIAAPSANISGKPSGTTFETVKSEFENGVVIYTNLSTKVAESPAGKLQPAEYRVG